METLRQSFPSFRFLYRRLAWWDHIKMDMGAGPQASRDSSIVLDGRRSRYANTEHGGMIGPCVGWILLCN